MKNIYIDMANLSGECRYKNIQIDFKRFYDYLNKKHKSDNIYIFTGFLEKNKNRYQEYEKIGFEYIFKEAVFNKIEEKIKANVDVDIAIKGVADTIEENLNESILITSDGDYASLVKFWKDRNVSVKIISPADPERCSFLLRTNNNKLTFLKQIEHNFILKK